MKRPRWIMRHLDETGRHTGFLQQIRVELAAVWFADSAPEVPSSVRKILSINVDASPTWEEILSAETTLVKHLTSESLRVKYTALWGEYCALAGSSAAPPPWGAINNPDDCTDDEIRNRVFELLAQTQRLRTLRNIFGYIRARVAMVATAAVILICVAMLCYFVLARMPHLTMLSPWASTTLTLTGMLGGCVSAVSRLYKVPWSAELANGIENPQHLFWSLAQYLVLATVQGGIFAILLYLIFMAGFLKGAFFPVLHRSNNIKLFHDFFEIAQASQEDYAKVLIWSFIAGFSERLVPDYLMTLQPHLKDTPKI